MNKINKTAIYLFTSFLRSEVNYEVNYGFPYTVQHAREVLLSLTYTLSHHLWVTFLKFYDAKVYKHNIKYLRLISAVSKNTQRRRSLNEASTWPSQGSLFCGRADSCPRALELTGLGPPSFPASPGPFHPSWVPGCFITRGVFGSQTCLCQWGFILHLWKVIKYYIN